MLFAAAALVEFRAAWRLRRRHVLVGLGCAIALGLVVNRPMRVSSDETWANFGAELLRLDRPSEAIPFLRRAVALAPDDLLNRRDLGQAYRRAGDRAAAAREYLKVGDQFMRMELPADARPAYEYALSLNAASPEDFVSLQVRMASLDQGEGRVADALTRLNQAAAAARANGLTEVARDVEATIQALRLARD